jgi:hypothetical protein
MAMLKPDGIYIHIIYIHYLYECTYLYLYVYIYIIYIWMHNHVSGHVLRPADPSDPRMPSPYGGPQRGHQIAPAVVCFGISLDKLTLSDDKGIN